jgi:hypothetical protein
MAKTTKKSKKKTTKQVGVLEHIAFQTAYVRVARVNGSLSIPNTLPANAANTVTVSVQPGSGNAPPQVMVLDTSTGNPVLAQNINVQALGNGGNLWQVNIAANALVAGHTYLFRATNNAQPNSPSGELDFDAN